MVAKLAILVCSICFVLAAPAKTKQQAAAVTNGGGDEWKLLKKSIGISAMHMALLPNNKIIVFDRTDFGTSNISLPHGICRNDPRDQAMVKDCSAHSIEYDIATRAIRPLTILTDTWCSSGTLASNGQLIQIGGFNDGDRVIRKISPCENCDWIEFPEALAARRWYASNQILPDGRIIVIGGRRQFNYEFVPKNSKSDYSVFDLPFLSETRDSAENNLYPFLHLSTDGNLFVFANTKAILLDYRNHRVVRNFPAMPAGESRNYPSSGSSVLLPLDLTKNVSAASDVEAEVLICGGAPANSIIQANKGHFMSALKTCCRLKITDSSPEWQTETMPFNRVMGDMILLPAGDVLIINGAAKGSAGWGVAREPVLNPVLYKIKIPPSGERFQVLSSSKIPRLYHSTAHLLPDGRILVGGSNPNIGYNFSGVLFPTELSLEAFSPPYLDSKTFVHRPRISFVKPGKKLGYKMGFSVVFEVKNVKKIGSVSVTMVAPSFTTHSFSMNQRVLVLLTAGLRQISGRTYEIESVSPVSAVLAPPGHYLLFVVHGRVPSRGEWVHIQ